MPVLVKVGRQIVVSVVTWTLQRTGWSSLTCVVDVTNPNSNERVCRAAEERAGLFVSSVKVVDVGQTTVSIGTLRLQL